MTHDHALNRARPRAATRNRGAYRGLHLTEIESSGLSMDIYLVGGAVRDELLGLPVMDRDWVVIGATPEELIRQGYRQIGNEFPCFLHPRTREEYALARTERKSGHGHQGFICEFGPDITLEEDLSRRDLTINAIARDTHGQYIDPCGGIADLKARILRHVSPAFSEDPLRVLRVARFAARYHHLGFKVHPQTLALMARMSRGGELGDLTPERVWNEIARALTEPTPSEFFRVLERCHALGELLPALDVDAAGVDGARRHFDDPVITWAVIVHDLDPGAVEALCRRLKTPREFLDLGCLVAAHLPRFTRLMELDAAGLLELILAADGLRRPQRLERFARACAAATQPRDDPQAGEDPRIARLLDAAGHARRVQARPLLDQGLKGDAIAAALARQRAAAIAAGLALTPGNDQ